jgi:hypothetical protein
MTTRETIDAIAEIRTGNNRQWMRLLEIALENAPEQTREVLTVINENDRAVSELLTQLANLVERKK